MQTLPNLIARLGGLAAVVGGLLWSAKSFYDRNDAPPWPTDLTDDLFFVVPLLFLVGLGDSTPVAGDASESGKPYPSWGSSRASLG